MFKFPNPFNKIEQPPIPPKKEQEPVADRAVHDALDETLNLSEKTAEEIAQETAAIFNLETARQAYDALDQKYQKFEHKITSRFTKITKKLESKKDDSAFAATSKWAGRALMAIPKIAAIPITFPKDIIMANIKAIKNGQTISSLESILDGDETPEKLIELMQLEAGSDEEEIIKEMFASDNSEIKKQVLNILTKKLVEQSQKELNQKTKFTKYFGAHAEVPQSVINANTQMEIIYLKYGVSPQNYEDCKMLEEVLKTDNKEEYKKLKALHTQIINQKESEETDSKIKGGWNFAQTDTSIRQKDNIASNSFKKGMLWHLLHDPGDIAGLATCTINGEYLGNLGRFDINNAFASRKMHAGLARDLLLLQNKNLFNPEMQVKIDKSFSLPTDNNRTQFLKQHSSSGRFAAAAYGKKQIQTMAYLGMRALGGVAYDQYKFWTGKQQESVLASEVAESGLGAQYADIMYSLEQDADETKMQEFANDFGYKLMELKNGGAESLVQQLVDRLIVKHAQNESPQQMEIDFLKQFQDFAKYQVDKGRMDASQLNRIQHIINQYKIEISSLDNASEEKLAILDQEGYDAGSFACAKSGKYWADLWLESKKFVQAQTGAISQAEYQAYRKSLERHKVFVNRNYSNLLVSAIGYQVDKTASLGYGGQLGGASFEGAIALEHHLLQDIGAGTAATLHNIPGIGEKTGDLYQTAKVGVEIAANAANIDFLTGNAISGLHTQEITAEELTQQTKELKQTNEEAMLAEYADDISEQLNIKGFLAQINQAREQSEQVSAAAMADIAEFVQEHRVPILALTAGAGLAVFLKNPLLLRELGTKALNSKTFQNLLSKSSSVFAHKFAPVGAAAGLGATTMAFSNEAEASSKSIWSESEVQLGKKLTDKLNTFKQNGTDTANTIEAYKTAYINKLKKAIINSPGKYGLNPNVDFDRLTDAQINNINWQQAINDTFPNGLELNLTQQQINSIVINNATLRDFFKKNDVPITSETVEAVLSGETNVKKLNKLAFPDRNRAVTRSIDTKDTDTTQQKTPPATTSTPKKNQ